jgi:hypothetical protein
MLIITIRRHRFISIPLKKNISRDILEAPIRDDPEPSRTLSYQILRDTTTVFVPYFVSRGWTEVPDIRVNANCRQSAPDGAAFINDNSKIGLGGFEPRTPSDGGARRQSP